VDDSDVTHNRYYTNRKTETKDDEDTNPSMAMFLGQQEEEKDEHLDDKCVYMQYLNKNIQKYYPALLKETDQGEFNDLWFNLSHLCFQMTAAYVVGELCIFTLSNNSKLSINGKLFSKDCTSMLITKEFVFFINSTQALFHHLYVYNLNKRLPLPVPDPNEPDMAKNIPKFPSIEESSFHIRNVERGARLICCNMTKTIIQMPRGNLEGES